MYHHQYPQRRQGRELSRDDTFNFIRSRSPTDGGRYPRDAIPGHGQAIPPSSPPEQLSAHQYSGTTQSDAVSSKASGATLVQDSRPTWQVNPASVSGVLTSSTSEAEYKEAMKRQHEYKNLRSGKPESNDSSWKHPLRDLKKKISGIVSIKGEERPTGGETKWIPTNTTLAEAALYRADTPPPPLTLHKPAASPFPEAPIAASAQGLRRVHQSSMRLRGQAAALHTPSTSSAGAHTLPVPAVSQTLAATSPVVRSSRPTAPRGLRRVGGLSRFRSNNNLNSTASLGLQDSTSSSSPDQLLSRPYESTVAGAAPFIAPGITTEVISSHALPGTFVSVQSSSLRTSALQRAPAATAPISSLHPAPSRSALRSADQAPLVTSAQTSAPRTSSRDIITTRTTTPGQNQQATSRSPSPQQDRDLIPAPLFSPRPGRSQITTFQPPPGLPPSSPPN